MVSDKELIQISAVFSASYSRNEPCFTAGKRIGVWNCRTTREHRKRDIFTFIVYNGQSDDSRLVQQRTAPQSLRWRDAKSREHRSHELLPQYHTASERPTGHSWSSKRVRTTETPCLPRVLYCSYCCAGSSLSAAREDPQTLRIPSVFLRTLSSSSSLLSLQTSPLPLFLYFSTGLNMFSAFHRIFSPFACDFSKKYKQKIL
jgi:hypothetical protein